MEKIRFLILLGVFASGLQAQELAMVGFSTVFDQTTHSARLAYLPEPASVGFEVNNRFVKELNVVKCFGAYSTPSGVLSGMYKTFGYAPYREHCLAVGLSRIITPRLALGLQAIPKIETFGKGYELQFSTDLNATCFTRLGQNLYGDSELNIPIRMSSNTRNDAPLQGFLRMSVSYVFSKQCQTVVSVKQMLPYKTDVLLQVCYWPISSLAFFGNVSSSGDCGFGVQYVFGQMLYRFQTHYRPIVGYSTTVGLSYQFKPSQKTAHYDS